MSMTTLTISAQRFANLDHVNPDPCNNRSQAFYFNPIGQIAISKHQNRCLFLGDRSLLLSNGNRSQTHNKSKMDFAVYSSDQPQDLISLGASLDPWKGWIFGGLMTVLVPFLTNKWGPLLKWANDVEAAADKMEDMAEKIEDVAVQVDKMAEGLAEKLPDGKFREAVKYVEHLAEETVKTADTLEELIDKVQEVEERVETMLEEMEDKSKVVPKVANDPK